MITTTNLTKSIWWPTTILVAHTPNAAFNDRLAGIILAKEREIVGKEEPIAVAGVQNGLTAYWTKFNVLNWPYAECTRFAEMITGAVRQFIATTADPDDPDYAVSGISCWANVLRQGESLHIHHHDPGFISAHYIVKSGNPPEIKEERESGHTVYYRPGFVDRSHGDVLGSPWDADWRISVPPREGTLTLFPSYVRHEVTTNIGGGERISIAMDVYLKKQRVPFNFAAPRWYVPKPVTRPAPARV